MFDQPVIEQRIGFVGLGEMGLPIARNLYQAGFDVVGFDVREDARSEFAETGADTVETTKAIGEKCQIVHVAVANDDQVRSVAEGPEGVFAGFDAADGGILVIHSTVHPDTCVDLAEETDHHVIDAALSGLRRRAEEGTLTLMIGGADDEVKYCWPLFEAVGESLFHLGPAGSGTAGKLANNLVAYSDILATAEGLELGTSYGIDEDHLIDLFQASSASNFYVDNWDFVTNRWDDEHPGGIEGVANLVSKDSLLILDLAAELGLDVPGAGVASQRTPAFLKSLGK